MANTKISALPASTTPLAGTEVLPIVQSSTTRQVSVANLTAGRAVATGALTVTGAATVSATLGVTGATTLSGLTASTALALDASKNIVSVTNTGTGSNVLATSPTLVTPTLGVATATSLQGIIGNVTPAAGAFTTVDASGAVTLSGGTANGVTYLNGSKVLTSGSALTFDGTKLLVSGSAASAYTNPFELKNTDGTGYLVSYMTVGSAQAAIRYAPTIFFKIGPDSGDTTTPLVFAVNNSTEVGRFTPAGNLGVGTTSPSYPISIERASQSTLEIKSTSTTGESRIYFSDTTAGMGAIEYQHNGDYMRFYTNNAERARITSAGDLLVGTTSNAALQNNNSLVVRAVGDTIQNHANGTASGSGYLFFGYNAGAIGSITQSGTTAVLYNTTSDQRLKENIKDADSASSLIDSLQVRQFDWKSDNSHQRYGFVAQELVTVAPEAVHQPIDTEDMMAVDYSKLVPMLVKEIQSLRQRLSAANL